MIPALCAIKSRSSYYYRGGNKGLFVLLSRTQAGPGRTVKQEQEEMSRNHVQTFIFPTVHIKFREYFTDGEGEALKKLKVTINFLHTGYDS